ncbi:MAG: RdgB/HAM1 family non-canonical purine NTP pyrophosphatase [Bacteroidetes bacterium]|nr:RdgB/HAM1 family non-canonical purine NTP pyrophosphatase [Bacteroidota bacterium]
MSNINMASIRSLPQLVLATRNTHKAAELKLLLSSASVETFDLSAFPDAPPVHETASTLKGNATLKALSAQRHTGLWALGDDTGLYIDALNGRPGVHSARFASEQADAEANRTLVLELLADKSNRTARFSTVLALAHPEGVHYFEGHLSGYIARSALSTQGFGYESIFIPDGFNISLAQLSREEKNKISHRAQSATRLVNFINNL